MKNVILELKVKAPEHLSPTQVASMVDTIIQVGLCEADASMDLYEEGRMNDPEVALSLRIGNCKAKRVS